MRTFIAIDLDRSIKSNLSALIQRINTGSAKIRWVKPEGMHLTLKFLGDIPEDRVHEIQKALSGLAKDYTRFPLTLKGTGTFPPPPGIARVIWIGIVEHELLKNLQSRIENELHKIHFPKEKRTFHPHLTLGRVKNPRNIGPILEGLDHHAQDEFGTMDVNRFILFKSTLRPTGAEYTALSEFDLG